MSNEPTLRELEQAAFDAMRRWMDAGQLTRLKMQLRLFDDGSGEGKFDASKATQRKLYPKGKPPPPPPKRPKGGTRRP